MFTFLRGSNRCNQCTHIFHLTTSTAGPEISVVLDLIALLSFTPVFKTREID